MVKKRTKSKTGKAKSASKKKAKSAVRKKTVKRAGKSKKAASKMPKKASAGLNLEKIGEITHYFPHVNAAAMKILKNTVKEGDQVYIKGHTTDFKEIIQSMQLDHQIIHEGKKGQEIGLLVKSRVRIGDSVYRI